MGFYYHSLEELIEVLISIEKYTKMENACFSFSFNEIKFRGKD